jgi:enoyl-[acyl-carrier protein] reductase I
MMMTRKALIVGVANERSLAWGVAQALHQEGVELAFTYQGEALERRVRPLAESVGSNFVEPCDVTNDTQVEQLFAKLRERWGTLDILVHSVAFANRQDLEGRFIDTSREGFRMALDISAYSLVALARQAEPLMEKQGGSIVTMSYYGAYKVLPNYNVMGVAKAALEAAVRYLAYDLGPKKIRVNAVSAGPVKTLAACGIKGFRDILSEMEQRTPMKENMSAEDVGALSAFLCGAGAKHITGATMYVDSGLHIMGV